MHTKDLIHSKEVVAIPRLLRKKNNSPDLTKNKF